MTDRRKWFYLSHAVPDKKIVVVVYTPAKLGLRHNDEYEGKRKLREKRRRGELL